MKVCLGCASAFTGSGYQCPLWGHVPQVKDGFPAFAPELASDEGLRGGGIILTVPQHAFLWSQQDEAACHVRRYSRGTLIEKVGRAGFNVEVATSFVSLLLPLMMWSRRRKRVPSDRFDPMAELKLGRIANTTLAGVMSVERSLIEWGARFPAGGSLLLVARKN